MVLAGRRRTLCGHQNQRPRSAAMDGVMNERTISVSNNSPRPMVVPIWPRIRRSLTMKEDIVAAELRPLALDRIKERAPQHLGFDAPLDEIVLRTGGNRGGPEIFVVQAGQHDYRNRRIAFGDAVESVDPAGVGQVQVQQHAIGPRRHQPALRFRRRPRPSDPDVSDRARDQVFHEYGVGAVVLDQQQRQ